MSLFITLEGPDGSGKTTQARLLAGRLREEGHEVLLTREPGGSAIGDRIRDILLDVAHEEMTPRAEFLLYSASRAQHVAQVIKPHVEKGHVVISDRFGDSSVAYQGYGHLLDLDAVREITRFATFGLLPDLTVYLDVPVEVGLGRKGKGRLDRLEANTVKFHRRVREGYLKMAREDPARWLVVDATAPVGEVHVIISEGVAPLLHRT